MKAFQPLSTVAQLAGHLREEILRGGLGGSMPGVNQLAGTLGVSPKTVIAAVKQLEREGMLQGQGPRRRCRIVLPVGGAVGRRLRVVILDYDQPGLDELELQHILEGEGHAAFFAGKSLLALGMDARRVSRLVAKTKADAWVVCAGSREVLEWFAAQPVPAFALFGRRRSVCHSRVPGRTTCRPISPQCADSSNSATGASCPGPPTCPAARMTGGRATPRPSSSMAARSGR